MSRAEQILDILDEALKKVDLGTTDGNAVKEIVDAAFKDVEKLPEFKALKEKGAKARVWQNILLGVVNTKAGDLRQLILKVPQINKKFLLKGKRENEVYSNRKLNPFMEARLDPISSGLLELVAEKGKVKKAALIAEIVDLMQVKTGEVEKKLRKLLDEEDLFMNPDGTIEDK